LDTTALYSELNDSGSSEQKSSLSLLANLLVGEDKPTLRDLERFKPTAAVTQEPWDMRKIERDGHKFTEICVPAGATACNATINYRSIISRAILAVGDDVIIKPLDVAPNSMIGHEKMTAIFDGYFRYMSEGSDKINKTKPTTTSGRVADCISEWSREHTFSTVKQKDHKCFTIFKVKSWVEKPTVQLNSEWRTASASESEQNKKEASALENLMNFVVKRLFVKTVNARIEQYRLRAPDLTHVRQKLIPVKLVKGKKGKQDTNVDIHIQTIKEVVWLSSSEYANITKYAGMAFNSAVDLWLKGIRKLENPQQHEKIISELSVLQDAKSHHNEFVRGVSANAGKRKSLMKEANIYKEEKKTGPNFGDVSTFLAKAPTARKLGKSDNSSTADAEILKKINDIGEFHSLVSVQMAGKAYGSEQKAISGIWTLGGLLFKSSDARIIALTALTSRASDGSLQPRSAYGGPARLTQDRDESNWGDYSRRNPYGIPEEESENDEPFDSEEEETSETEH
jgi:hypothetical protein